MEAKLKNKDKSVVKLKLSIADAHILATVCGYRLSVTQVVSNIHDGISHEHGNHEIQGVLSKIFSTLTNIEKVKRYRK